MSYCNIQLIRALRRSRRLREEHGNQSAAVRQEMSLTATLVLIVLLFFILVSPSEILHFSSFLVGSEDIRQHELWAAITNALNTLNFATNFLFLSYLGVNFDFRRSLRQILCRLTTPAIEGRPASQAPWYTGLPPPMCDPVNHNRENEPYRHSHFITEILLWTRIVNDQIENLVEDFRNNRFGVISWTKEGLIV